MRATFDAELFLWQGDATSWTFLRLPVDLADAIRDEQPQPRRGFGSVKVNATIGTSQWSTSVFPEKESGSYLLPVKKQIRAAEHVDHGDRVTVSLEI